MSNQDIITVLQGKTKKIRNLCILAHVDHGNVFSFKLIEKFKNLIMLTK